MLAASLNLQIPKKIANPKKPMSQTSERRSKPVPKGFGLSPKDDYFH